MIKEYCNIEFYPLHQVIIWIFEDYIFRNAIQTFDIGIRWLRMGLNTCWVPWKYNFLEY